MLDWTWNSTRQPARSRSSAVVTTISGLSSAAIRVLKSRSAMGASFPATADDFQGCSIPLLGRPWPQRRQLSRGRRAWSGEQFDPNRGVAGWYLAVEGYQRSVASLGKSCQVVIGPQLVALVG